MKTFLHFFICLISLSTSAQLIRVEITGHIIVENDNLEGISIYNKTSKDGTVSDKDGFFNIRTKEGDVLQIRALQYQDFDIVINEQMIDSKRINVFLIQEVNQLDEIIISNKKVTGNLKTDINKVPTFEPKLDAIYFAIKQEPKLNESPADFTRNNIAITNATSQNKPLVNGLDLVNVVDQLLLPLFRSEAKDKKKIGVSKVPPEAIKYYFGSEFLNDNFNIPKHRVEEFIRFVELGDFDYTLLNYGREIEFLELLNKKSKEFLKKRTNSKN